MPAAKPALQPETSAITTSEVSPIQRVTNPLNSGPRRVTTTTAKPTVRSFPAPRKDTSFQPRVPVITGEATYRGMVPVDGIITGQLGANGSVLAIKQRPKNGAPDATPELNGEITFKGMLRINGHIAGKVFSFKGTLIVDGSAKVEALIDVGVCVISGIVVGNVVAHERVEVGSGAVITGNISTPLLSIKPGAVFQGDCRMLKEENGDK